MRQPVDPVVTRPGDEYRVQVLDRVFSLLDALAAERRELGGMEIAQRIGLHKSTVHRLLAVLENNRYVERNPANAKYRLGWRLFELGMIATAGVDIYERAKPEVESLVAQTGETAHVGVLRQGAIVSLVNAESRSSVRTPSTVGHRNPFHCTSQGKAILAFLPAARLNELLEGYEFQQFTRKTITSRKQFLAELAAIRKHGYAIDDEEFEEGLRCIGAPVRDHSGEVIGAISIAGPSFRVSGERMVPLSAAVRQAGIRLSAVLGFREERPSERTASKR